MDKYIKSMRIDQINYQEKIIGRIREFWERKDLEKIEKELKMIEKILRDRLCKRLEVIFSKDKERLLKLNNLIRILRLLKSIERICEKEEFLKLDPERTIKRFVKENYEKFRENYNQEFSWFQEWSERCREKFNGFLAYNIIKQRTEYSYLFSNLLTFPKYKEYRQLKIYFAKKLKEVIKESLKLPNIISTVEVLEDYILDTNVFLASLSFTELMLESYQKDLVKIKFLRDGELKKEFKKHLPNLYSRFANTNGDLSPPPEIPEIRKSGLDPGEIEGLEILKKVIDEGKNGNFYTSDLEAFEKGRKLFDTNENRIQFYLRFFVDFSRFIHKNKILGFIKKFQSKFESVQNELEESVNKNVKEELRTTCREALPEFFRFIEQNIFLMAIS